MGVIAAALGMALASADQGAAADVAFYAANHVLVKAALFLTVGAVAALDGRARTLALIVAALLGLSLAGLPLTGGALAKLALKDLFGDGAAGVASQLSAAATHRAHALFVMRLARSPRDAGAASPGRSGPGRRWPSPRCSCPGSCSPPSEVRLRRSSPRSSGTRSGRCSSAPRSLRGCGRRGSASAHSRWRHCRRRGGCVPRLAVSRAHVRAGRSRLARVAGGGPCAARGRARPRLCGMGKPVSLFPERCGAHLRLISLLLSLRITNT